MLFSIWHPLQTRRIITNFNRFMIMWNPSAIFLHLSVERPTRRALCLQAQQLLMGFSSGINTLDQPLRPANVYAFSKVQLENLAHAFLRSHPHRHIIGLRYFNVYGPREAHKGTAASMIYQLARQMKIWPMPTRL
jgi:hypothetical protein